MISLLHPFAQHHMPFSNSKLIATIIYFLCAIINLCRLQCDQNPDHTISLTLKGFLRRREQVCDHQQSVIIFKVTLMLQNTNKTYKYDHMVTRDKHRSLAVIVVRG